MFETRYLFEPTAHAMATEMLDKDYDKAWSGFEKAAVT
jgi:homogentisate 1,2-dioxygenase